MRVTFVVAALDMGGGIRVIAQYAEGLRQRGHDVTVVVPAQRPYRLSDKIGNLLPFGNRRFKKSHFDGTGVKVKVLERFRPVRASDAPEADIVIATWWETAEWIADFPENRGRKVHFVQGYEIWNGDQERVDACLGLPTKKITISRYIERILVDDLKLEPPELIPNGVDRELFYPGDRKFPKVPTFGFIYASGKLKGSDLAIRALVEARKIYPDLRAVAFGHRIPDSGLAIPEFVDYYEDPSQEKIREIYSSCTAWIFSSRLEGFGLPIIEAMACGTPVIATPVGAAPDIISNGGGNLVKNIKYEEILEYILSYCAIKKEEWKKISFDALCISKKFSLDESTLKFSEFIEGLL